MTVLYALQHGAVLHKNHDRIIVSSDGEEIASIPTANISSVVALSGVQVTTQALLHLLDNGIDLTFLSDRGGFRGSIQSATSKNAPLRIQQYECHANAAFRLTFAKVLVASKVRSSLALLRRYSYSPRSEYIFDETQFGDFMTRIDGVDNLTTLLGVEGAIAKIYFGEYARLFKSAQFSGRKYFPSVDPVNAALSLGYSAVAREIQANIQAVGLDPFIGFFHQVSYGRASLAMDLLEELRAPVIDRLVLRVFNQGMLDERDFEMNDGSCVLRKPNLKRFFQAYEDFMRKPNLRVDGKRLTPRQVIRAQVLRCRESIYKVAALKPLMEEE